MKTAIFVCYITYDVHDEKLLFCVVTNFCSTLLRPGNIAFVNIWQMQSVT